MIMTQENPFNQIVISRLKTIAEVCDCSVKTLKVWIRKEEFPAWKKAGMWRALPEDIKAWMVEQKNKNSLDC